MSCPYYLHNINFCLTLRRYNAFGEDAANLFDGRIFKKVFDFEGVLYLLLYLNIRMALPCKLSLNPKIRPFGKKQIKLRNMQFSTRKAEYIIDLSKAIVSGDLNLDALEDLPDEEISARLTGLRGIGRWTVDWFLARYLGRGCAFPAGDLGVRKAVEHYYFHGEKQAEENLRDFARQWGEFTNFVVHYLLLGFYSKD